MPEWTTGLISQLNEADERAGRLVDGISVEQLNWQPVEAAWSVGQCLDHLCATNNVYLPPMAAALEGKAKGAVEEIRPGWFGRLFFEEKVIEPSAESIRAKGAEEDRAGVASGRVRDGTVSGGQSEVAKAD